MAYQSVKTPRFYINTLEWLNFSGQQTYLPSIYKTLPVNPTNNIGDAGNIPTHNALNSKSFIAFLGTKGSFKARLNSSTDATTIDGGGLINCDAAFNSEGYDGFILGAFDGTDVNNIEVKSENSEYELGSAVIGTYYSMVHSPDLNLTLTREYGSTKTVETKGGATLSNTYWIKPPNWGDDLPAWGLSGAEGITSLSVSGRRIWNLTFSYLDEEDVLPEVSSLTSYGSSFFNESDPQYKAFLNNNANSNFFTEVIHKTAGGALPFIFNPSGEAKPDDYAICKFDQNSFKFTKISDTLYSISLKIREVW